MTLIFDLQFITPFFISQFEVLNYRFNTSAWILGLVYLVLELLLFTQWFTFGRFPLTCGNGRLLKRYGRMQSMDSIS